MFSSRAEIKISQRRDLVGRQVCLDEPPLFSSYLMDQVFLQDSIPLRRQPTSSALEKSPVALKRINCCVKRSYPNHLRHSSITMSNHGDDCYFYYYSTCTKGDSCPFRHCEAAKGNETVCNLWQEGCCFRTVCKFRHMEITKKRKEISCYWERQAAGCQKPHCAFFHEKPRFVDGLYVPPDKGPTKNVEQPLEEPSPPPAAPLPTAANPQLRGVKAEAQELVPSPTHPPVVINPADDDEDEDDQFSEGEDGKAGHSPRKLPKSDNSLNFGVSTLEEIRLRKALKASMKRAGYPLQNSDPSANREKENIQSLFRPAMNESGNGPHVFEETIRQRGNMAERLGRKTPNTDMKYLEGVPQKRSLAERLGRVVEEDEPPKKASKPIKERLNLSVRSEATQPAETNTESRKAPGQIRIKTLAEIKLEKAAKSEFPSKDGPSVAAPESNNTKLTKVVKRAITLKGHPINQVKTFSEIFRAKRKTPEEEHAKHMADETPGKSQGECDTAVPGLEATNLGEVKVKTLEEIRREKAARIQNKQSLEDESKKSSDSEENIAKKSRLLRIKKPASQPVEKKDDMTEMPPKAAPPEVSVASSNNVKVKTFEEIMREKQLRKQEIEERAKGSAEAVLKQTAEGTLKRKIPAEVSLTPPSSPSSTSLASDITLPTQESPVRKRISLKSKAGSPLNSSATDIKGASVTSTKQSSSSPESRSQSPSLSAQVPDKNTRNSGSTVLSAKQARAPLQGPAVEAPADKTPNNQEKSQQHTEKTKVRPKLNVKPSVMKPAVRVKPGQKRRGAGKSAVAAVKPLNSTSTVREEPQHEKARRDGQGFLRSGAEAKQSSAVPLGPSTLLDTSPLREELQTVPSFKQAVSQDTKPTVDVAAPREDSTVPQSPVMKTPTQPRSRRTSVAASTSTVDVFEELINEFTNEHLQDEDVDPEIGEDDLLQELSEMIDS